VQQPPSPKKRRGRQQQRHRRTPPARIAALPTELAERIVSYLAADVSFLLQPSDVMQYAAALQGISAAPAGDLVCFAASALLEHDWLRSAAPGTPPYIYEWLRSPTSPVPVKAATNYKQLGVHPAGWQPAAADDEREPMLSPAQQASARCAARRLYGGSTRSWLLHLLRTTAHPVQPFDQTSGRPVELLTPAVDAALEWIADQFTEWCLQHPRETAQLLPFAPHTHSIDIIRWSWSDYEEHVEPTAEQIRDPEYLPLPPVAEMLYRWLPRTL